MDKVPQEHLESFATKISTIKTRTVSHSLVTRSRRRKRDDRTRRGTEGSWISGDHYETESYKEGVESSWDQTG